MSDIDAPAMTDAQAAISPDGETVILAITAANDQRLTVRLSGQELSKMVTFLLATARDAAARQTRGFAVQKGLPAKPLPIHSLGVAQGSSESEAILALRLGILTLSFSADLDTLLRTCQDLHLLTRRKTDAPVKH